MILPYVYKCTNRITEEFYIGYRCNNKTYSYLDLPKYKTSASYVRNSFNLFDWEIIAEFFDPQEAYEYEQKLISSFWGNPKLLNRSCYYNKRQFKRQGPLSKKSIEKMIFTKSNKSPEEKAIFKNKMKTIVKNWFKNLTVERQLEIKSKISKTQLDRTPEEKSIISNKLSTIVTQWHKNLPEETKILISNKRKAKWAQNKLLGIKKKLPSNVKCSYCSLECTPNNLSRHIIARHNS